MVQAGLATVAFTDRSSNSRLFRHRLNGISTRFTIEDHGRTRRLTWCKSNCDFQLKRRRRKIRWKKKKKKKWLGSTSFADSIASRPRSTLCYDCAKPSCATARFEFIGEGRCFVDVRRRLRKKAFIKGHTRASFFHGHGPLFVIATS